jgi:hypothetical protein
LPMMGEPLGEVAIARGCQTLLNELV